MVSVIAAVFPANTGYVALMHCRSCCVMFFMCTVREEKLQKETVYTCLCTIRQTHYHKIWCFEFKKIRFVVFWYDSTYIKVHILHIRKGSRNRPGVAQRVPGDLSSQVFMTFGTWRWWGRQPHAPAAFIPQKCSWCSFSLGAESTPGPLYGRKEIRHWKIQWHHRESIPRPSV
jgi:hypothetical protein